MAQQGLSVQLFERERFPRFHIGESLIPETYWVLERLGMLEQMKSSQFVKKYSVQFISASGPTLESHEVESGRLLLKVRPSAPEHQLMLSFEKSTTASKDELAVPTFAIAQRDLPLIQGIALSFALIFAIVNLVVDLLYAAVDPRVRLG